MSLVGKDKKNMDSFQFFLPKLYTIPVLKIYKSLIINLFIQIVHKIHTAQTMS